MLLFELPMRVSILASKQREQLLHETPELKHTCLENHSLYKKQIYANETKEQKAIRLEKKKSKKQNVGVVNAQSLESFSNRFHAQGSEGPIYSCFICDRLWYKQSVLLVTKLTSIVNDAIKKCIPSVNSGCVCKTCCNKYSLKNDKIPKSAIANKMGFPVLPSNFSDTTQLEWRLVPP